VLFVDPVFFVFFAIVLAVHWTLRSNTWRKTWLLACNHFFYAGFFIGNPWEFYLKIRDHLPLPDGWWFPFVLMGSTVMDYVVGRGIGAVQTERARRAWLLVSLVVNLGVLCFFKYYNFFVASASDFLTWIGLPASNWTLKIFLPYGISFYTFQSMSYSIDVYRRRLEPVRNFLDLAFFISFFPQLVAGPIVRAITFLPQAREMRLWQNVDVRGCLMLFFSGFVKKACIAGHAATFADTFFAAPERFTVFGTFIGVLFYAVQIYCDFSGYTDMAIASARLLGYELTANFNFPYFAANITDFWRRWHISLSTWLRDYLYIPLGGNRGSKLFTYRNLMLTMLLGGLWHGASWTFVIWGGMHGVALIVHREWERLTANAGRWLRATMRWLGPVLCFYWICVTWVFFRAAPVLDAQTHELKASGFKVAQTILNAFVLFRENGPRTFRTEWLWSLVVLAIAHWIASRGYFTRLWRRLPDWAFAVLLGALTATALAFVPTKFKPFIYFQF
jgi:D-alanyl-lipoteichoic acid acyltransferase DltB (MBOAT superfamily)